jgi:hypothetical protein
MKIFKDSDLFGTILGIGFIGAAIMYVIIELFIPILRP